MQLPKQWEIKDILIITIIILFPFNLLLGRIFPQLISLPFYSIEILIIILGIILIFKWKDLKLTKKQKYVITILTLFILLGIITITKNSEAITEFITTQDPTRVKQSIFKKILNSDITHAINETIHIILALILFIGISTTKARKENIFKALCITAIVILLANCYLLTTQTDVKFDSGIQKESIQPYKITTVGRAYFPFVNTILLSFFLSGIIFIFFYQYTTTKNKKGKAVLFSLSILLIMILAATKSRTTTAISFIIFSLMSIYFFKRKKEVWKRNKQYLITICVILIITNMFVFTFHNFSLTKTILKTEDIKTENTKTESINQEIKAQYTEFYQRRRNYHWPTAITLFKTNPLLGVGTGLYSHSIRHKEKDALCKTKTLCPNNIKAPSDISSSAHSIYFQKLAENGIIGSFLFLLLLGVILKSAYLKAQKNIYRTILFCIIVSFLIQGLTQSYFIFRETLYFFWIIVGLILKKEE
jgi:O-antigen ligase